MSAPTLSFDRSIPFVDAVWRIIEGKARLDDAIDVLTRAERAHGLFVLGEPYDLYVNDMYVLRPGVSPPTFAELVRVIQEYLEQSVEGYEPWRETVQRILNEKTSRWAG
jgi:hypothetical protein